jgi:hypothetical protein
MISGVFRGVRTVTAGLDESVDLAERVGVDLDVFIRAGVCDLDFREGAFEELCDGLWALVAGVFAAVDHGADELGGGVGVVSSPHDR